MDRLEPRSDRSPLSPDVRGVPAQVRSVLSAGGERESQTSKGVPARLAEHYTVLVAGREVKAQGPQGLKPGDPVFVLKQPDGSFILKPDIPPGSVPRGFKLSGTSLANPGIAGRGPAEPASAATRSLSSQVTPEKSNVSQTSFAGGGRTDPAIADIVRQAFGAAKMPLPAPVVARLAAEIQVFGVKLGLSDRRDLIRIAAVLRELERKGIRLDPGLHGDIVSEIAGLPGNADITVDTAFGGGSHRRGARESFSQEQLAEKPQALAMETVLDLFNSSASGEGVWQCFVPGPGCIVRLFFPGRVSSNDAGQETYSGPEWRIDTKPAVANADIEGPDGRWSFHWNEDRRGVMWVDGPEGSEIPARDELPAFLADLGFDRIETMANDSWYDGFYFSPQLFIIKPIDLLG